MNETDHGNTDDSGRTNHLLGYPADARLLIVNADDFGMCHAINDAILRTHEAGLVRSTSLMMPGLAALQATDLLRDHPDIAFGVHLTVICDTVVDRFGPLAPAEKVRSLIDEAGFFYSFERMPEFLARAKLDELEAEFRAQIEAVLAAGLKPTHLDWHCLRFDDRAEIPDLMFGLAKEYGLALRVVGRTMIEQVQGHGLPANDYDFLDSFGLEPVDKVAQVGRLLRELPVGLSEWAVHPGFDNAELRRIQPDGDGAHVRQTDYDFLMSQAIQETVKAEGIFLVDYRPLQAVWSRA